MIKRKMTEGSLTNVDSTRVYRVSILNTGLCPPNITTLSSEIIMNEKLAHGGGGLPDAVGLDQHSADRHHAVYYTCSTICIYKQ